MNVAVVNSATPQIAFDRMTALGWGGITAEQIAEAMAGNDDLFSLPLNCSPVAV